MMRSAAVVGGGIGGLTAALALSGAGFAVTVHEQAGLVSTAGAGIQLAPNCTRVLRDLGLLPAVEAVAVRAETFEFRRWDDGRLLSETLLGAAMDREYGAPFFQVHRADLMAILVDALPAGTVRTGRRCTGVSAGGERPRLRFSDDTEVVADVVVGADGIHSVVRQALLGPDEPRFTGHVAYRGLIPAERVAGLGLPRRCTLWMGPGGHLIHYFVATGRLLNVVGLVEEGSWTRESWTDPGDPADLRAGFVGWHPVVQGVLDAMDRPLKWALFDREPMPRWGEGAVTLLGDACHPMLPYGAQGAAQAIEDAAVLAACLSDEDIPAALARYEAQRRERTSRVQAISRENGRRFHLPDGPEQEARDRVMASSFGLSREIDWLYGYDVQAACVTG